MNWDEIYKTGHDNRFPWSDLVTLVHRFAPSPKHVVELGCGTGANSSLFRDGTQYIGYDASRVALDIAEARWRFPHVFFIELDLEIYHPVTNVLANAGLVFDRATIPHLTRNAGRRLIDHVREHVKAGTIYIGVDWFSVDHFDHGQFNDIETVTRYSQLQIRTMFADWELLHLEHKRRERIIPGKPTFGAFDVVARKRTVE